MVVGNQDKSCPESERERIICAAIGERLAWNLQSGVPDPGTVEAGEVVVPPVSGYPKRLCTRSVASHNSALFKTGMWEMVS